jgi:transcriptional repressor NrdR
MFEYFLARKKKMRCPFCNHEDSKVTDSRNATELNAVRRRRECVQCLKRFTTFEMLDVSLQVKKRDGTYEDFQQEKLIRGMDSACRHTKVSTNQVRMIADRINSDLITQGTREINSRELGEIVMEKLREIDTVAYIRFACVYKRFTQIKELLEAIESIAPQKE